MSWGVGGGVRKCWERSKKMCRGVRRGVGKCWGRCREVLG